MEVIAFMRKPLNIILAFILVLLAAGLCPAEQWETAPAPLPGVQANQERADFWIARHPDPDRPILAPEGIEAMNRTALGFPETELADVLAVPDPLEGAVVRRAIAEVLAESRQSKGYDHTNRLITAAFYDRIETSIGAVPAVIRPAWGLVTARASLRRLPTNEAFYDRPFGNEFDRFQYSALECGNPVAVLHRTADGTWAFVRTSYTMGWVPAAAIALGDKPSIESFMRSRPLVATGGMVPVYADRGFSVHAVSIPMGTRLPLVEKAGRHISVTLPWRAPDGGVRFVTGYIRPEADVSVGYLPYTARNLYRQLFKLEGHPYGWGDLFDGRDCSRLVMDVFSTFGFAMPRNSRRQAAFNPAGRRDTASLSEADKVKILKELGSRPALLYMPGHIMIHLGVVDGKPFAIHSAWGLRESRLLGERTLMAGRVVVSDVTRGGGARGSLLKRVTAITPLG
ncbi:MAG: SH3 domain of the SH3b1 type [Syntrophaceae bacterium PtaB.Bin038]|nr:MAG: SH3 domain of the SH3b1 type [Syntrophaceae bacterium PtaB.Bin038]